MNETEIAIETLVNRLRAIARRNGDDFAFQVVIRPSKGGFEYAFKVTSNFEPPGADHVLRGTGDTILEAIQSAEADIPDALKAWGYEE